MQRKRRSEPLSQGGLQSNQVVTGHAADAHAGSTLLLLYVPARLCPPLSGCVSSTERIVAVQTLISYARLDSDVALAVPKPRQTRIANLLAVIRVDVPDPAATNAKLFFRLSGTEEGPSTERRKARVPRRCMILPS